jgi:hypothetical protein
MSSLLILPGTLPRNASTSERSQVGITCPQLSCGIIGWHEKNVQSSCRSLYGSTDHLCSGLSWKGTLAGKEVYCPPQGFKGAQVMAALDQFLVSNPDMAEKSYGDAMAASLSRAFPCQPQ